MKFSALASAVLFSTLLFGQGNTPPNVVHADGAFGNISTYTNNTGIYLTVSRGTNTFTGEQSAFLYYDLYGWTSDGFTDTFGYGSIPTDSLTGGNPAHLTLNVDTSQLTSFWTTTCTFSFSNWTYSCTSGPEGLINIDWKQNGNYSMHTVATTQQSFFQYTVQSHGESDQGSATVNGSMLGLALNDGWGWDGTNRNVTISMYNNH